MTIDEIKHSNAVYITAAEAASVLHCDPHTIRVQAHRDPRALGYPVIVTGRRVRIPRIPFLNLLAGGGAK